MLEELGVSRNRCTNCYSFVLANGVLGDHAHGDPMAIDPKGLHSLDEGEEPHDLPSKQTIPRPYLALQSGAGVKSTEDFSFPHRGL